MAEPGDLNNATPRLHRAVTRLLGREAGGDGANSEDLATASGRLLDRLAQWLAQIPARPLAWGRDADTTPA
jgi:hypothetical protein